MTEQDELRFADLFDFLDSIEELNDELIKNAADRAIRDEYRNQLYRNRMNVRNLKIDVKKAYNLTKCNK